MNSSRSKGPGIHLAGSKERGISHYWSLAPAARHLLLILQHLELDPISNTDSQTLFHLVSSSSGGREVVWWETQLLDSDFQHLNAALALIIL